MNVSNFLTGSNSGTCLPRTMIAVGAFALAVSPLTAVAQQDDNSTPFSEANVFFELNNTDGDLGIHASIDGGPWRRLFIETPSEQKILRINAWGRLGRQGLTQLFFESAEPTFDELPPRVFFRRFPEGIYEVEGVTLDGQELESESELTHTMPAPPEPTVNGQPFATQCDEEEPGFNITTVSKPVTISWPQVTMSHPDLGTMPPVPVVIRNYEVVVEYETEVLGEPLVVKANFILPPDQTSMNLPWRFLRRADTFKYEVLAREESHNQTATESCFQVE